MQPVFTPTKLAPLTSAGFQMPTAEEKAAVLNKQVDEFAALLYAQMFRQMRESSESEEGQGLFGGGDTYLFADFFDKEIGKTFAAGDGGALKEGLRRQLESALEAQQAKGETR